MAFRTTWRWMFWSTSIFQAVMILVSFTVFHETYAPTILSRRAAKLREDTGDNRYYTIHERLISNKSIVRILGQALSRPMRLLTFHPIIQITSLMSAFSYGVLYIVLSSFAELWTKKYNTSVELSGLHYLAVAFGEIAGSQVAAPIMDLYYRRKRAQQPNMEVPSEHRIPLAIPGALIGPLAVFMYGWCAEYKVHWVLVDIGVFLTCFGLQINDMPVTAYVMDAYVDHTSSARAAEQFLRSLTAFLFPLFTPIMYEKMGYGWGNSALAFAGLGLSLPALLALWYVGPRLRQSIPSSE